MFHDLELPLYFLNLLVYIQDRNWDSRDFNTTNSRIMRVTKRAWVVGTFFGTMSWGVCVAMGALVRGTIPFDVALEGAAMAFVSFVMGMGLVLGVPNACDFVVVQLLPGIIPVGNFRNS